MERSLEDKRSNIKNNSTYRQAQKRTGQPAIRRKRRKSYQVIGRMRETINIIVMIVLKISLGFSMMQSEKIPNMSRIRYCAS